MECYKFSEDNTFNHYNNERLNGYLYENVFDNNLFVALKNQVERIFYNSTTHTFLTHTTIFSVGDESKKIISHAENDRKQHVLFDLSFEPEYYYQTVNSIVSWSNQKIKNSLSPVFTKCIQTFNNCEPMNKDEWICFRLHLNVLEFENFLSMHFDTGNLMYNTRNSQSARAFSVTYYLDDHIPGCGGELFSVNGFNYKPKKNCAIAINGNSVMHGVNANNHPDKKTRLAFTMRFAHIQDLFLPGHPDKCLYKPADV